MSNEILELVNDFNKLIKNAITGPNCVDPLVCDGNCCFIQIKVPKILASFYIEHNWANENDFIRDSDFSFKINVNLKTLRCNFFDKQLNGCRLHNTNYKAPHCWIYPTGLDINDINHSCKKMDGWDIIDTDSVNKAKILIKRYVELCKKEAIIENNQENINNRLNAGVFSEIIKFAPSKIAGLTDNWDKFSILSGEGYNMGLNSFCSDIKCDHEYFECKNVCTQLQDILFNFFKETIGKFIEKNGFRENYTIIDLKKKI